MSRRKVTKPQQAMSARQVDRVEKGLTLILRSTGYHREGNGLPSCHLCKVAVRISKLLASVRRSERR